VNVTAADLIGLMRQHRLRVFTTSDMATLAGFKSGAAAQALRRLAESKIIVRVKRGVWVNQLVDDLNPFEVVPYLTAPWPGYVSLYSALADTGMIEEIPQVVYAVSSDIPARYRTAIGAFHFHYLPPRLIWGYEIKKVGSAAYPIADAEKAFLDLVYLALSKRSPLELPYKRGNHWKLDRGKIKAYSLRFKSRTLGEYLRHAGFIET
jgi:predicted transcriptional regulator of viral defense system